MHRPLRYNLYDTFIRARGSFVTLSPHIRSTRAMRFLLGASLALAWAAGAQAVCSSNLLIDNYSNYANHLNTLGQFTSGEFPQEIQFGRTDTDIAGDR